jgi:hypothetical protein
MGKPANSVWPFKAEEIGVRAGRAGDQMSDVVRASRVRRGKAGSMLGLVTGYRAIVQDILNILGKTGTIIVTEAP